MEASYRRGRFARIESRNVLSQGFIQNSTVKAFLCGSCSGTICAILLQPLDVIKTRLQNPSITLKSFSVRSNRPKIVEIITDVIKHENAKGLWKGTTATLARTVPGIGLYFSGLTHIKVCFFKNKVPNATESLFIGAIARSIAGAVLMPLTVVKTRVESGVYKYSGVLLAVGDIFKNEGIKGLTRGLVPTIFRDAPYAGLYFMCYTQSKSFVPKDIYSNYTSPVNFSCAITSSTLASFATQPPDVFKTQLQLYPNKFNGLRSVIVHVYIQHGILGYFQGILPRLLRRTVVAAISWTLYEKVMQTTKHQY